MAIHEVLGNVIRFGRRRRVADVALATGPSLALGALLIAARHNMYWLGALWGLGMLLSLHGWGLLVALLVKPRERIDVGLSLSWGLAATFLLGGVACAMHVAARPFLIGQVVVGSLLTIPLRMKPFRLARSRRRLLCAIAWPFPYLVALAALARPIADYVGLIAEYHFNVADDPPLYIFMAEKIVKTGSTLDPFNSRRVALYGGVDYLNAQFIAVGKEYQLHVVDGGIAALMAFALIIGAVAPRGLRRVNPALLAAPLLLLATLDEARVNIGSLLTGAVAFLGVYRTFVWMDDQASGDQKVAYRRLALLGACVMATGILRPTNAVPAAAFVALALARRRFLEVPSARRRAIWLSLRDTVFVGISCLASCVPWLVVFHESVGTFVYPFSKGNTTPGFALVKVEPGLAYNLKHVISDLSFPGAIHTSLLCLTAGILPLGWGVPGRKHPKDFVPLLAVVCFVGMCFTSYISGVCEDWVNARYLYGFMVGSIFAITISIAPRVAAHKTGTSPRALLVVAAVVVHAVAMRDAIKNLFLVRVDSFEHGRTKPAEDARGDLQRTHEYEDVQAHVPEHEAAAVIVNEPYRLNLGRNEIYSLDISPGGLGPKPGFPIFKGPEVLADYLLRHGVRYLVAGNLHDQINVDAWRGHLHDEHSYMGYEAPIVVDALESIEKIVQTRRVLYEAFGMKVIDLRSKPQGQLGS